MIHYKSSLNGITVKQLEGGFFEGWPNPPKAETHLKLLKNSSECVIAIDDTCSRVVGYITAISDGVLSAYIPFLEVLPPYRGQGIGKELTQRLLNQLGDLYMVDLLCDRELVPFYEKFNMIKCHGMMKRNLGNQSGRGN